MSKPTLTETKYGFRWGPVKVERCISDDNGWVVLEITTANGMARTLYVSPKGNRVTLQNPYRAPAGAFAKDD